MVGRKDFCFLKIYVFYFGHLGAIIEIKTHFPLHPALSRVVRGILRGCLRGGPAVARLGAGVLRDKVLHRLRRLLSLREAFSKALHSWSKQAA